MNPIKKKAIKAEFERSNLTLEEICDKYSIDPEELGNTSSWDKIVTPAEIAPTEVTAPIQSSSPQVVKAADNYDMLEEIAEAKREALRVAKQFFTNLDLEDYTIKDIKDMMGVLKDIEAGELVKQSKGQGPTLNLVVQNLVQRFKDDC